MSKAEDIAKAIYIRCFDDEFEYPDVLNALRICAEENAETIEQLQNAAARAKWHDLRVNPDDLPELKKTKSGEIYNPLVLCFEYKSDSRGKLAKVYALDRWEPDADRWQNNIYSSYTAWRELPEPPAESVEAAK